MDQIIRGHCNGVSRREKERLNLAAIGFPRFQQIRINTLNGPHPKTGPFL